MQCAVACNGWDPLVQNPPDLYDEGLAAGQLALHKIHVHVEVFVVELLDNLLADEGAKALQVHHEACLRIGMALDRGNELKIVAMPVFVGTGAKYLHVLFRCPLRVVKFVGGVKMFLAGDVDHRFQKFPANFGNNPEQPAAGGLLIQADVPVIQEIAYQHDVFLVF